MSVFKDHHPTCESCSSPCDYIAILSVPQVAFKDGPSGSWPSKVGRFKDFRAKQSAKMEKRQQDRYGHISTTAIPNYNGQDTGTWKEAQYQALKDKGLESASTFTTKVKEESDKGIKTLVSRPTFNVGS